MKLWSKRMSVAYGWMWKHERDVTAETMLEWLLIFRKDEPGIDFVLTDGKQSEKTLLGPQRRYIAS